MICLCKDGRPCVQITIPPQPLPVQRHAARELSRYLKEITGADVPVSSTPREAGGNVYVGLAAPGHGLDLSEEVLGFDGFVVKTTGKELVLTGVEPYSCLYAVYHLLERHLGCGFFENGDQVPRRDTIEIGPLDDVEKPRFEWRIFALFHTPGYSGMRWYDFDEWKQWFDWVIKKRFNMVEANWLSMYTGIAALAAGTFGVEIELTEWQRHNQALLRRLFDYARMCGVRFIYEAAYHTPQVTGRPGSMPYYDGVQIQEFIRRFEELTGETIPTLPYTWCGLTFPWLDPAHPLTHRFVSACVEKEAHVLGTDHLHLLNFPAEGEWGQATQAEREQRDYAMLMDMIDAVKAGDPKATIFSRPPFPYAKAYGAQKRALRDAGVPVVADFWLNVPARTPDFKINDYYWGLPWSTGMVITCGKWTNPWGDMQTAIDHAHALLADTRADKCRGFFVCGETNHRLFLATELLCELAWNPAGVDRDDFLRRWTARRYGPDVANRLLPAVMAQADTLMSCENRELANRPMYRNWSSDYMPGLVPTSAKRTLSYLPALRSALDVLLAEADALEESPLYRFDVVDLGRTYLGAIFNYELAGARRAFRAADADGFEHHAGRTLDIMDGIARLVSADPSFRLATHDDRARRCPEILPGEDNVQSNWITFTCTQAWETFDALLDYTAEDYAELIAHYFRPRVAKYLDKMRQLLAEGRDIDETKYNVPFTISDWATPQGMLPWSPFAPVREPELIGDDYALAQELIRAGTVSGQFDFHEGPVAPLMEELLHRFPVPKDLDVLLTEPDPTVQAFKRQLLEGTVGDVIDGFHPGVVEQVRVPDELTYVVSLTTVVDRYSIARGNLKAWQVDVSDWLKLTRLEDGVSERGGHAVMVFEFDSDHRRWRLTYDPGTDETFAALYIDSVEDRPGST